MSCKSILLLSFLWQRKSNLMDTKSIRTDKHTHHKRPNYHIHCRQVSVELRVKQEIKIKHGFQKKVNMTIWTDFLIQIDLGHGNNNLRSQEWFFWVTGIKKIGAKFHCYKIYLKERYLMDITCVQLQLMSFIHQVCLVNG